MTLFIEYTVCLVFLTSSVSMMFYMTSMLSRIIQDNQSIIYEKADGVVSVENEIAEYSDGCIVSYVDIVAMLLGGLEYDIRIDTVFIGKNEFYPTEFNYRGIACCNYKKEFRFDTDGNIVYVSFTSIG